MTDIRTISEVFDNLKHLNNISNLTEDQAWNLVCRVSSFKTIPNMTLDEMKLLLEKILKEAILYCRVVSSLVKLEYNDQALPKLLKEIYIEFEQDSFLEEPILRFTKWPNMPAPQEELNNAVEMLFCVMS